MDKKTTLLFSLILALGILLIGGQTALANWVLDSSGRLFYQTDQKVLGRSEKARVLLESQDNKLRLKFMDERGRKVEDISEGTESGEFEIEEPEDKNTVTIRSHENAALVIRNKLAAQTHFPLMVNLETNELIVTTPKGQKVVTVLPDQAVQHMLAANVLDQLGGKGGIRWLEYQRSIATPSASPVATPSATPTASPSATPEATSTPEPTVSPEPVSLETGITLTADQEGNLIYEIEGFKNKKLLGLFKIVLKRTAVVSAETGELISVRQDLLTRILDLMSF